MRKATIEQREFHSADGIEVVTIVAPEANTFIEQHQHNISHITFVASGSVIPVVDFEEEAILHAGQAITVEAYKTHCFYTLEPNTTLLCITNIAIGSTVKADKPRVLPKEFELGE